MPKQSKQPDPTQATLSTGERPNVELVECSTDGCTAMTYTYPGNVTPFCPRCKNDRHHAISAKLRGGM